MEFGQDQYDYLSNYCRERDIEWSASPWDLDSLQFLDQYDIPFIKIPSAMLTNKELIEASCHTGKKVILSTGMSTLEEVDDAVGWMKNITNNIYLILINRKTIQIIMVIKIYYLIAVLNKATSNFL